MVFRWVRKSDGSLAYGYRQGDGNWYLVPRGFWPDPPPGCERDGRPSVAANDSAPGNATSPPLRRSTVEVMSPYASTQVCDFLRQIGRMGGKARARRHSRTELAAWGRVRQKKAAKSHQSDLPRGENEEVSS